MHRITTLIFLRIQRHCTSTLSRRQIPGAQIPVSRTYTPPSSARSRGQSNRPNSRACGLDESPLRPACPPIPPPSGAGDKFVSPWGISCTQLEIGPASAAGFSSARQPKSGLAQVCGSSRTILPSLSTPTRSKSARSASFCFSPIVALARRAATAAQSPGTTCKDLLIGLLRQAEDRLCF
jgi:hypothetical protein